MTDAPNYDEFPNHREMTRCAAPFRKAQASIKTIIDDMRRVPHSSARFLADCLTDLLGDVTAFVTLDRYDAGPNDIADAQAMIETMWWKQPAETPPDFSRLEREKAERQTLPPSIAYAALAGGIATTTRNSSL